mgnify:CR=1 FL=1
MGRDKNKSLFAIAREKLRDYLFFWLWFKSAKIYGNRLHKTVRLSRSTYLDKAYPGGVKIDEYTYLARGVNVMAHDFCRLKGGETIIGKRCFIGSNAIIMCNVKIGDEVIVGAGAVVTKDVPSNCIVAGNPAKIIRQNIHTGKYGYLIDSSNEKVE